jgi:hypothetical protein
MKSAEGREFDPFAIALSAIENASTIPVSRTDLPALLKAGEGEPSHLRALFGDVDFNTLRRMANILNIDGETLARAYRAARRRTAAANPELDEFAAEFDLWRS